jgi:hypothetical protein
MERIAEKLMAHMNDEKLIAMEKYNKLIATAPPPGFKDMEDILLNCGACALAVCAHLESLHRHACCILLLRCCKRCERCYCWFNAQQ